MPRLRAYSLKVAMAMALVLAGAAVPPQAGARLSPNCLLNGAKAYCAITPLTAAASPEDTALTVTLADHRAFRLTRRDKSCQQKGTSTLCAASITLSNGYGEKFEGTYTGVPYEGGYRHTYKAGTITITYFYLD